MITPQEFIDEVENVLRRGWTQGAMARNIKGQPVMAAGGEAVSWCMEGAFSKVRAQFGFPCSNVSFTEAHEAVATVTGGAITLFNDVESKKSFKNVIAVLNEARKELE